MAGTEERGSIGIGGRFCRKTLASVLVAIVILSAALYVFYDLNGHSLDPTDREVLLIVTDSMDAGPTDYPISTIPVNSLVMIEHLEEDELGQVEVGDVLSFRSMGMVISHRVIDIDPDARTFTTKGDNETATETVPYDRVVGEVVGVNHLLGEFVYMVKAAPFLVIGAVVILMIMCFAIGNILRTSKQKENRS